MASLARQVYSAAAHWMFRPDTYSLCKIRRYKLCCSSRSGYLGVRTSSRVKIIHFEVCIRVENEWLHSLAGWKDSYCWNQWHHRLYRNKKYYHVWQKPHSQSVIDPWLINLVHIIITSANQFFFFVCTLQLSCSSRRKQMIAIYYSNVPQITINVLVQGGNELFPAKLMCLVLGALHLCSYRNILRSTSSPNHIG